MKDLLFFLILFVTNAIQAITGFAGTLLAMPPSILLVGAEKARIVLNLLAFLTCAVIVLQNRKAVQEKILARIVVFMAVGMAAGIGLYRVVQIEFLLYIYGALIILVALTNLKSSQEIELKEWMAVAILLVAGIIHGMFVSGGALLVVYASIVLKDKVEFRATVAAVWVVLNAFLMVEELFSGGFTKENTILCALACIPAFAGVWVGNRLHDKISAEGFRRMTYVLLLISGVLCFV